MPAWIPASRTGELSASAGVFLTDSFRQANCFPAASMDVAAPMGESLVEQTTQRQLLH
jgi:hypothetical protein